MDIDHNKFWDIGEHYHKSLCVPKFKPFDEKLHLEDTINFHEFSRDPRKTIENIFAKRFDVSPLPIRDWEKKVLRALHYKFLEERFKGEQVQNIANLNDPSVVKVKDGQLVTFRCMIQDVVGPEYSLSRTEFIDPVTNLATLRSNLLQDVDVAEIDDGDDLSSNLTEKEVLIGISPPGENFWVSRINEEENEAKMCDKKIKLDDSNGKNDSSFVNLPDYMQIAPSLFVNSGDSKPMACVLKMYRNDADAIKHNAIVEVTGIINFVDSDLKENELFEEGIYPGILKLPVIHVFSFLKLADGNPKLPLIDGKLLPMFDTSNLRLVDSAFALRELLSLSLDGDRYAALYAMVAMISRIIQRDINGHGPVGKLVLNVSGITEESDAPELLQRVFKAITPRTLCLDLSVEKMNSWILTPKKNLHTNQLEPGLLQLSDGTLIIINETVLKEGKLLEEGIRNVEVLKELLIDQQVKYNYTYQYPSLPIDCPVIIVSKSPSILPHDVKIQINPDTKSSPGERRIKLEQMLLEKAPLLQNYMSMVRSIPLASYPLFSDDSLKDDFEAYFKARNQPNAFKSKMTPMDFSCFITSCRLWSLLHGDVSISREGFMFWKEIDQIRDSRS